MDKCSEVSCDNPVMKNSQLNCCEECEEVLKESLDSEYRKNQEELYNDYNADISLSVSEALSATR